MAAENTSESWELLGGGGGGSVVNERKKVDVMVFVAL